jgi:endoplasmic reticulum-Golgi intermediate compartment protein 3
MEFIRKLDLFPKTMDDFRVKTATGGALSLVSITLMLLLFIAELRNYYIPVRIIELFLVLRFDQFFIM